MVREIDTSCAITRTTVPALDEILGHAFPVLDHGFVRVIDYMGDDTAIVQMARTSYGQGTKAVSDDEGLIRYLMRHRHTSPFEGCEIKLHVKLPVFVARQWIRHRTANVNEYSARYSILDREFYIPESKHLAPQSGTNKQGREGAYEQSEASFIRRLIERNSEESYQVYQTLVDDESEGGEFGLARELARINLPVNIYTQWYWKVDLHNLFHFLLLRADPHAQYEIRVYAELMCELVRHWVPSAYRAWEDYQRQAVTFSRMEMRALRFALNEGGDIAEVLKECGMSSREVTEFRKKIEHG
jgi:thymidylate synthase (FAD)